jgi:para-aminobenzoate synthetase/4-amino-4-deoxychorismate lyase
VKYAAIRDCVRGCWLGFSRPVEVLSAHDIDDVPPVLERIDQAIERRGQCAVGMICYEAAPAFDPALRVRPPANGLPIVLFGLYEDVEHTVRPRVVPSSNHSIGEWRPSVTPEAYLETVDSIRERIARGDTYQVNYSYRMRADFTGDPASLFLSMDEAQHARCGAYIDTGTHVICSASPELFFQLDGDLIRCRPMKGTSPRGHDLAADLDRMAALRGSEKNRAENVMIVDMVRNDLGRIAEVGSVRVAADCEIERYPTVLQMTSTVEARTQEPVSRILGALFPSASITGAPKVRTMEIINDLEGDPRGIYTGTIGYVSPGRRAHFNVAIRTAVIDTSRNTLEYGVGGGIVWDSVAEEEHAECGIKARILTEPHPDFNLLETILWEQDDGYFLLDRHLDRLQNAADYFLRPLDMNNVRASLETLAAELGPNPHRVRLFVSPTGGVSTETKPLSAEAECKRPRLRLAAKPISSANHFLYFKTTHREVYDSALDGRQDCDDVVLWNERGEVTESTVANIVFEIDGVHATPPVSCGLLAGTYRAELIHRGEICEQVVTIDDLPNADGVYLINSVRRRIDVRWVRESARVGRRPAEGV